MTHGEGWTDGRSSRWDGHRALRREQLIDAAIAAVDEFGSDVGVDQIAAVARTSKPVIYRYFGDKDDLYRAVAARFVTQTVQALQVVRDDPDPRALLRAGIDAYLQQLEDNPRLFRFLARHQLLTEARAAKPPTGEHADPISALLTAMLGEHLRAGGLSPSAAAPWGEAIVGFLRAASLWWMDNPALMTRAALTEYITALLWGGMAGVYQSTGHDVDGRPAPGVFPPLPLS